MQEPACDARSVECLEDGETTFEGEKMIAFEENVDSPAQAQPQVGST